MMAPQQLDQGIGFQGMDPGMGFQGGMDQGMMVNQGMMGGGMMMNQFNMTQGFSGGVSPFSSIVTHFDSNKTNKTTRWEILTKCCLSREPSTTKSRSVFKKG